VSIPRYWSQLLKPILDGLTEQKGQLALTGMHGSAVAFVVSLLAEAAGVDARSWALIAASDEDAERIFHDLTFFHSMMGRSAEHLALFPEWETLPYEATAPHVDLVSRRMRTLRRLTVHQPTLLVTSVPALSQRLLPQAVFTDACFTLAAGATVERELLTTRLLRLGYRRVSVVEIPGEFSIRGGIVDLYSTAYDEPLRVEFLGDTVESIRLFDPSTQKSTGTVPQVWLLPARELLYPGDRTEVFAPLPADAEWRGPDVYPRMECLLDYFAHPPVIALNQPEALAQKAADFADEVTEAYARYGSTAQPAPYPVPDRLYLDWADIAARLLSGACLALAPVATLDSSWQPALAFPGKAPSSVGLGVRGRPFSETLTVLDRLRTQGLVLVVARSRGQVDRLLSLFGEHNLPAERWAPAVWSRPHAQKPPLFVIHGELSAGFASPEGRLAVVTEEELFAKELRHRPAPKSKAAAFLSSLEDVSLGDYVVHVQHGIARYEGLRRLSIQGFDSDYLVLSFAGGDTLYVPLDRLNQIQKYKAAEGHSPRLDRLGGQSWARTKARVKDGIEEMAEELVELYASREVVHRHAYAGDSTLTHEFEAAFEYEETPDQLRAIEDIKRDMESPKPMDRLVCGDVGYGKTEVAMRAAFKAVENNRQVAVLVPTTLLAQQHYENFAQRFAPFPVRVAMLSRFQSPRETTAILRDVATGTIDVVIGTHRLLQKDVQFRNLGLVVIDEEQWFGVRHKERLKQLRTQVDVLTLTATPIPRTLQLGLSGVRDLSVIETPPAGRLAIRSQICRYNENLVREAIIRELGRGGQVFFVHNRVQTMARTAARLRELVPEARIVMAHGQMDERLLESTMLTFIKREADVLVATAIIQSGLDVPNANTILISRADTFGLAQLYQLRGRVGRAGHQAYAYFFTSDEGALTGDAQRRLVAIQDFTELGSGFRIAAADLEIRGAGNLLGKQQSGHIAAVGLDLYLQMMEQAVQRLKGTVPVEEEEPDPTLQLNVSAFIPDTYVPDAHHRLSIYKRLSACQQVGELALLHGEIQDRYGPLPDPVERLFEVMEIRLSAKALRLASVEAGPGGARIAFNPKHPVPEHGMRRLMDRYQRRLRLSSPTSFELQIAAQDWTGLFPELNVALQTLLDGVMKKPAESRVAG